MSCITLFALLAVTVCPMLGGCGRRGTSSDDSGETPPNQAAIVMTVSGARVMLAPMNRELNLLGTTVAARHITLRAPAAGRITGFNLRVGPTVQKGTIVAHIVNREVEAAANGLSVAGQIDRADAPALAAALKRNPVAPALAVRAPANGIVGQALVSDGQLVSDFDPLADLVDPDSVYVEAAVPASEVTAVRPGMPARIVTPVGPGHALAGRIAAIAPNFSPAGATALARIEFITKEKISEIGAPVQVSVTTASNPTAIVIPAAALFQDAVNDSWYVFVEGADGRAHRRPVTLGTRTAERVQIQSGVEPGQVVITSGGYALSDGLRVHVAL
jgi:multidrug efflux pump subunit AcrA (membrane-fusion protein)